MREQRVREEMREKPAVRSKVAEKITSPSASDTERSLRDH